MRIVHLSKSDYRGACSRGVLALHRQLRERSIDSRFFSLEQLSEAAEPLLPADTLPIADFVQHAVFDQNPAHALASGFTLGFPSRGRVDGQALGDADVVHIHDIKGLLSPHALNRLIRSGKPIVWSLSDMWAFTGGCHQALDCRGYQRDCKDCVQLRSDKCGLPSVLLEKKRALPEGASLHLLSTSRWLAERARESRIFGDAPVHVLPALVSDALRPQPRHEAKVQLGFDPEAFTLLMVCENTAGQQRHRAAFKNFLEECFLYNAFKGLARKKKLRVLILGRAPEDLQHPSGAIHVESAGDDKKLSLLLSAADLAVLPHFEENGVQIVLEAARCGTPVIAMNAAGINECIQDGVTGRLVPALEPRRMAEEISHLALHPEILTEWSENCLRASERAPRDAAAQHAALYEQLACASPQTAAHEPLEIVAHDLREEVSDWTYLFLDALNFGLETVTDAAQAQAQSALATTELLKTEIKTALSKLALADQRIKEELGAQPKNPLLARAIASVRKVGHRLARTLREIQFKEQQARRIRIFTVPNPASQPKAAPALGRWDRVLLWAYDAYLKKKQTHKLGVLIQYKPRPIALEKFPRPRVAAHKLPTIALVTPSYMQGPFIEQTIRSVVDQDYPQLRYAVQDAASTDETVDILKKYSSRIDSWVSEPDTGQARAVLSGFEKISGDIMAWLNSDDLLMPGALRFVGEYFRRNPGVDAIYGHRVVIDEHDREIARWVLPPHDPDVLRSIDYVPQETLFWRRSLWEKAGGVDPKYRFALDWDMLLRFQGAGAKIVRVPYYLGCFRVHTLQKTSAQMETIGSDEIDYLRSRSDGAVTDLKELVKVTDRAMRQSALCEWLLSHGVRW